MIVSVEPATLLLLPTALAAASEIVCAVHEPASSHTTTERYRFPHPISSACLFTSSATWAIRDQLSGSAATSKVSAAVANLTPPSLLSAPAGVAGEPAWECPTGRTSCEGRADLSPWFLRPTMPRVDAERW